MKPSYKVKVCCKNLQLFHRSEAQADTFAIIKQVSQVDLHFTRFIRADKADLRASALSSLMQEE